MPTAGREMPFEGNQYGEEYSDINEFVSDQLHTDLGRSQLGIPAAVDDYRRLCSQSVPNTRHTATSQCSSWDTISGTSNTESYSLIGDLHLENSPVEHDVTDQSAAPPQITVSELHGGYSLDAGIFHPPWNGQQAYGALGFAPQSLPPLQTDLLPRFDYTPDPSPSSHSRSSSGSFANQSPREGFTSEPSCDATSSFSYLDLSPRGWAAGDLSAYDYHIETVRHSANQNTEEISSASGSVISPSISTIRALAATSGYEYAQKDSNQDSNAVPVLHGQKRKRQSPKLSSKRKDLPKINKVREKHACIRCKFMREPVR